MCKQLSVHNGFTVQVEPPLFTIEDDVLPNATESQTDPDKKLSTESLSLISVDELLDSVSVVSCSLAECCGFAAFAEIRQKISK